MFRSYLLIALRNLRRQKTLTLINIFGMALGMAGFTLFAHMSGVKLNADKFHTDADRIFGVIQVRPTETGERVHSALCPAPLLEALEQEFPEIEAGVRIRPAGRLVLKHRRDSFFERGILFVDPDFLKLFSFRLKAGDPDSALMHPSSIVISEAMALKYFGDENPIGNTLTLGESTELTVTGVTRNFPRTSSIRFEFLIPMESGREILGDLEDWRSTLTMSFVRLPEGTAAAGLESRMNGLLSRYGPSGGDSPERMYLFPFLDFRLKSRHITSHMNPSHPAFAFVPLLIGILLLAVVGINFINLATVRAMHRTREVGLRKVVGARRWQLICQFLGESVLLAVLAVPIAIVFYELIHPALASYMGVIASSSTTSQQANSIFNYPYLFKYITAAAILTGLFSGIYPALFLSAFRPTRALSGSLHKGRAKRRGSKFLVVFQFSLSIIFIASAWIVRQQGGHFMRADLGFNRERVAAVRVPREAADRMQAFREELMHLPAVERVTAAGNLPLVWEEEQPVRAADANKEEAIDVKAYGVDYQFLETLKMRVGLGRAFARASGDRDGLVLNRTAVSRLGLQNPLGERLTVGDRTGTVIGVVEDFLFADIGFGIPPALFFLETERLPFLLIKFAPGVSFPELKQAMKVKWRSLAPDLPFTAFTLEEHFGQTFTMIDRMAGFLTAVGLVVVLFAGLGLLGLASYLVEGRTREIGIRRVMGATIPKVSWLIVREFLILILIANIIAQALIFFGWHKVLQTGLMFMTPIGPAIPLGAAALTFLAALAAVGFQTIKTAGMDPVRCLRCE